MARKAKRKYGRGAGTMRCTAISAARRRAVPAEKAAIAIGLSKARKEGKKVPRKKAS
jgi:Family of unknown function (DUF6496)